jgi:hypothetical protein
MLVCTEMIIVLIRRIHEGDVAKAMQHMSNGEDVFIEVYTTNVR